MQNFPYLQGLLSWPIVKSTMDPTDYQKTVSSPKKTSRGVIIGKFMPPHMGHCYLADFARGFVDELWIFVCSLPHEVIPGTLRYQWMADLFPGARVVHIEEVNPAANRHQDGAQGIWARAVAERIKAPVDFVFASEDYGWAFARELSATFVPVDPSRDQFPISGTELRERPFRHWHHLPKLVRPWFVKTIALDFSRSSLGNDKAGEAFLAELATLLQTLYVPRYDRFYQNFAPSHSPEAGLLRTAQRAQHEALKSQARFFLLCSAESLWPDADNPPDLIIPLQDDSTATSIRDYIHQQWADLF